MESFTIENGVLIKADPCLTHAVIPEGVREIGKEAFGEGKYSPHTNDLLQSVVIPSTVGKISDYAFSRCAALTKHLPVFLVNPVFTPTHPSKLRNNRL